MEVTKMVTSMEVGGEATLKIKNYLKCFKLYRNSNAKECLY